MQLALFNIEQAIEEIQPTEYDKYIVAFSGGKDSIACFLHLLEIGVPVEKIELWHHLIDGKDDTFMDWEVTEDYCRQFAAHFNVPIYFSWKEGGFKREMLRENQLTAPTSFETPEEIVVTTGGTRGKSATRRKFPQISPDLSVRWCSAYLKIDVCSTAIRNQERFNNIKTCLISGERAEESAARAKYAELEPDRADNRNGKRVKRHVDRWRPVKNWTEQEVWHIIERFKVVAHPCYYMGWSRCSCKFCIFGNADQFASAFSVSPKIGQELIEQEQDFGVTMKRNTDLSNLIAKGEVYAQVTDESRRIATSTTYTGEITTNNWRIPSGAFGEGCGPS